VIFAHHHVVGEGQTHSLAEEIVLDTKIGALVEFADIPVFLPKFIETPRPRFLVISAVPVVVGEES